MKSLRSYVITESVCSKAQDIIAKLGIHDALWDDEELVKHYNMKHLDIHVSSSEPKCLRVVAKPVSKYRKNLDGYNQLIKDLKVVGEELNLVVCIEDQKLPQAQADICKKNGFTYQHGRKTRYELPTLTEYYYIP